MQDRNAKLEHLMTQALRRQPPLRAPSGLETRVLSELARRAALPWWRMSFMHWPFVVKAAFLLLCAALGKLAFTSTEWVLGAATAPVSSMRSTAQAASSLGDTAQLLVNLIPGYWLYIGAIVGVSIYLAIFGLGATAYRTLYK